MGGVIMTENFEEKTLSRETIFSGKIIDVAVDKVRLPDGSVGQRELVFHNGGVGIIAITSDNRILLVKQYRKPLERTILEIPAGKLDREGEEPILTAHRELEEEVGYRCEKMEPYMTFSLSPGFANEMMHLFIAKGLYQVPDPLPRDDDEWLSIHQLTLDEAKQAIATGEICDSKTIIAIMQWEIESIGGSMNGE